MTANIFPTPQQLADMLLACCDFQDAEASATEDLGYDGAGTGMFWVALRVPTNTGYFMDGFWYDYSNPAEDFRWAAKRFAEIVKDAYHYKYL